jgi:hypothetical protein
VPVRSKKHILDSPLLARRCGQAPVGVQVPVRHEVIAAGRTLMHDLVNAAVSVAVDDVARAVGGDACAWVAGRKRRVGDAGEIVVGDATQRPGCKRTTNSGPLPSSDNLGLSLPASGGRAY